MSETGTDRRAEARKLVREATAPAAVPFVPEITLLTAAEPFGLWDRTRREEPPFWAFPWAGGQGLARYVLDHPALVAGRSVLDVASGSGLAAVAAAKAGAAAVTACDVDENALAAIALNAELNAVPQVTPCRADLIPAAAAGPGRGPGMLPAADVVLAADVFYQRELAAAVLAFLTAARGAGATAVAADPGRAFLPRSCLAAVATYQVPVLPSLEGAAVRSVTVYELP